MYYSIYGPINSCPINLMRYRLKYQQCPYGALQISRLSIQNTNSKFISFEITCSSNIITPTIRRQTSSRAPQLPASVCRCLGLFVLTAVAPAHPSNLSTLFIKSAYYFNTWARFNTICSSIFVRQRGHIPAFPFAKEQASVKVCLCLGQLSVCLADCVSVSLLECPVPGPRPPPWILEYLAYLPNTKSSFIFFMCSEQLCQDSSFIIFTLFPLVH